MSMKDRKVFFIRNRLVKNDYKVPQKTSCFFTDTQKQYISSKKFCSTHNSLRNSIHSSQENSSKACKVEIPSITSSNFKKLQLLIDSKRKIKNSSNLPNPDKTLNKNEDLPLPPHLLASHLSTLHPSPSLRLYASLRKKIIPSIHSPPPPNSGHPSPPGPTFSPTSSSLPPPPPNGKRLSIKFSICEGINHLLKNKIFLRVLRDFGENVNFLRETVGLNSSTRILQKISGYTNQIGSLLVSQSKPKEDALLNENNDINLKSGHLNLSLEHLTERIKMSYNLITRDKVEGCFDEKFLHVLVYYNRNLEDFIAKMNEEMIRNGADEYREKVDNLKNLINSKRKGEKIEILIGTPQISVLSRMEKIEGELGQLDYISNRTRIKARFLDKLLSCKYSS